jgi:hypothetical protein
MDRIDEIMAEARRLKSEGKLTDHEVARLCLDKFLYMKETGGTQHTLSSHCCPACLKYDTGPQRCRTDTDSVRCMLAKSGYICYDASSPYSELYSAKDTKDQAAYDKQVDWFIDFFETWLRDNPEGK